ncbi:MAG: MFS transporter [Silicimonas sp.]|nr:MFS transporter [Silicimonas sp.]
MSTGTHGALLHYSCMKGSSRIADAVYSAVADTSRNGDLEGVANSDERGNFLRHAASLALTKTADGLIDPKLVLSWLLQSIGASSFWIGLLVPVREAGALLPQLLTSERIHALPRRKWAWSAGSAVQGVAAAGIAVAGVALEGNLAGVAIVLLLAILALARSVCSVSYKDVLGKTVGKTRRGTATGLASSVASTAVIAFAIVLMTGWFERFAVVIAALTLAAAFWLLASALFSTLSEPESRNDKPEGTFRAALAQMSAFTEDAQLRRFIVARGLLVGTALAPPYLVILASEAGQTAFESLGVLLLASSVAALVSGYLWGRLSDRSSRRVLVYSGITAAAALSAAVLASWAGLMGAFITVPFILFALMLSYNGVRQGRSTHLVDMADEDTRAKYTAVSNTLIGIILLGSGLFGAIASSFGAVWTIALFALMSLAGAAAAYRLQEVQGD